jgi:GAF domain-containing protein
MNLVPDISQLDGVPDDVWPVLTQLARAFRLKDADLQPTLDAIVAAAVRMVPPAAYAGLILVVRGSLVPQATLGEPAAILDMWQHEQGAGPCIDAAERQSLVVVPDTSDDQRWPGFGAHAAAVGVASMLCAPLWVEDQRLGALSVYSQEAHVFTDHHSQIMDLFATHAALALADVQRAENLRIALRSRDVIGQAKGILIERHKLTADGAFSRLAAASQNANRKLTAVALHLVETGELLGVDSRR